MRSFCFVRRAAHSAVLFAIVVTTALSVRGDDVAQCSKLLTQDEVKAAVGEAFDEVSEPTIYAEGHSVCAFFGAEGKSVMLTFLDPGAIHNGMISAESVAEYFDMNVRSTEEVGGLKGKPLQGIGVRAVLFSTPERPTIMIETKKGFAEVASAGLTEKQLEAVAKAVAP